MRLLFTYALWIALMPWVSLSLIYWGYAGIGIVFGITDDDGQRESFSVTGCLICYVALAGAIFFWVRSKDRKARKRKARTFDPFNHRIEVLGVSIDRAQPRHGGWWEVSARCSIRVLGTQSVGVERVFSFEKAPRNLTVADVVRALSCVRWYLGSGGSASVGWDVWCLPEEVRTMYGVVRIA